MQRISVATTLLPITCSNFDYIKSTGTHEERKLGEITWQTFRKRYSLLANLHFFLTVRHQDVFHAKVVGVAGLD